jgi:hypothetical protein
LTQHIWWLHSGHAINRNGTCSFVARRFDGAAMLLLSNRGEGDGLLAFAPRSRKHALETVLTCEWHVLTRRQISEA